LDYTPHYNPWERNARDQSKNLSIDVKRKKNPSSRGVREAYTSTLGSLEPVLGRISDEPRIGFSDRIFSNPGCRIIGFSDEKISDFGASDSDFRISVPTLARTTEPAAVAVVGE
jgi:hypothetical protein